MAATQTLDSAQTQTAPVPAPKRTWIIVAAGALLVLVVVCLAVIAFLLLQQRRAAAPAAAPAAAQRAAPAKPKGPPLYVALDPPFVTNFNGDPQVRFLQVSAQVMTHDQATQELVKASDPLLRNDLLLLFSSQKSADLATREGREHLRAQALDTVRHVIGAAGGHPEQVDAVLFTSFVMQ